MTGAGNFECPTCRSRFQLRKGYFRTLYGLTAVIVWLTARAVGIHGDALFATFFLALLPAYFVVVLVNTRLFPPDVEPSGDYHGILYDTAPNAESPSNQVDSQEALGERPSGVGEARVEAGRQMFAGAGERRSVQETVFATLGIALLISLLWMAARPVLYRIAPEYGSTFSGPATFPIKLHIGDTALGVTNPSDERWTCKIELGVWTLYGSTLVIESQQIRELPFSKFQRAVDHVDRTPLSAAREKIRVDCAEGSGITHLWETQ